MRTARARSFVDPRFLGGVALIVLAVLVAVFLLRGGDDSRPCYVARSDLAPDDIVTADSFDRVDAVVPEGLYVEAGAEVKGRVTRPIAKGELVPVSALTDASATGERIVVGLAQPLPSTIARGDALSLWVAPERGGSGEPTLLARDAVYLGSVDERTAALGTVSIEVRVPGSEVSALVGALGAGQNLIAIAHG